MTVIETFYNKNHDPKTGRFTSGPGGGASFGGPDYVGWGSDFGKGRGLDLDRFETELAEVAAPILEKYGLTAEISVVANDNVDSVGFSIVMKEEDGDRVGALYRTMTPWAGGSVQVTNDGWKMRKEFQGKGIATAMTARLEEWYLANNVYRVTVDANADVGGYAWAKAGFQFMDKSDAKWYISLLTQHGASDEEVNSLRERFQAGEEILPYEIAMAGHAPGAKDWPGRAVMLRSSWSGVKVLGESSVTASLQQFYSPSQPRDGRGRWTRRGGFGSPDTLPGMEGLTPYDPEEWEQAWSGGKSNAQQQIEEHHDRLIDNFGQRYREKRGKDLTPGLGKAMLMDDPAVDGFGWANYTDEWAEPTNAFLRGSDRDYEVQMYSDWDAEFIAEHLDKDIEKWSMPFAEDSFVFRGITKDLPPEISPDGWSPGTVIEDPGFLSTTADRAVANRFKKSDGWAMVYKVPAGTRFLPGVDHESEAILPRNSRSRVVNVDHDNRIVYLDYEGHTALTASGMETFYSASQPRDGRGRWKKSGGFGSGEALTAEDLKVPEILIERFGTIKPEDPITAAKNANPMGGDYNCQMCVASWELRQRGLNVVARDGIGGSQGSTDYWQTWFDYQGGATSIRELGGLGQDGKLTSDVYDEKVRGSLVKHLDTMPNESRGFFNLQWTQGMNEGSGHIMGWVKDENGSVTLVDPQPEPPLTYLLSDPGSTFWQKYPIINYAVRTDNAPAKTQLLNALTTPEQIAQAQEAKEVWRQLQTQYSMQAMGIIEQRTELRRQLQAHAFPDADAYLAAAQQEIDLTESIDQLAEPVRKASKELRAIEANLYKNRIALQKAQQQAMNPLG